MIEETTILIREMTIGIGKVGVGIVCGPAIWLRRADFWAEVRG